MSANNSDIIKCISITTIEEKKQQRGLFQGFSKGIDSQILCQIFSELSLFVVLLE